MTTTPLAIFPFEIEDPEELDRLRQRFELHFRKSDDEDGCWLWTAHKDKDGYGQLKFRGSANRAHRISYQLYNGPIQDGMDIDHVCRVRACVNPGPKHLEEVTHEENMRRMRASAKDGTYLIPNALTTPETVLEWVQEIIDRSSDVWYPTGRAGSGGWPVMNATEPDWRDIGFEEGYLPKGDKFAIPALYLKAVELGVNWKVAAQQILLMSPFSVTNWSSKNKMWAEDSAAAKVEGMKHRASELEERTIDALEARMPSAEYKDLVALAKVFADKAVKADRAKRENDTPLLPPVTLQFLGTPEEQAKTALALVEAIEAEYRELPEEGIDDSSD